VEEADLGDNGVRYRVVVGLRGSHQLTLTVFVLRKVAGTLEHSCRKMSRTPLFRTRGSVSFNCPAEPDSYRRLPRCTCEFYV
jgi:hypothetical protein